ncbi:MAG: phosphoribosylformylglycinamidine synthase subunit PurL [Planctomycetota bacterium]
MIHRIEVWPQPGRSDPHAAGIAVQGRELGVSGITEMRSARLFFVQGDLTDEQLARLGAELLADPVTERAVIGASDDAGAAAVVEVHLKPGVMDPVAASAEMAARDMGLPVEAVRTARRYVFFGTLTDEQRDRLTRRLLANAVIEDVYHAAHTPAERDVAPYELQVVTMNIRDLDDDALEALSASNDLFLNLTEMKAIRAYYREQDREPTDVELETLAQTWSEHCVHKTFRSDVEVVDADGTVVETIPNLIKSTIFDATAQLDKPWCLSVFEDNAGVIAFDDEHALAFKVETHNHPSALDPYGGASTGIGGVIRDPLGTGRGARPVANTDVFCFGDVFMDTDDVPAGLLHPRRIMRGVVAGVRDYGNRMGIPTVNGAICFDDNYLGNPLVFCGTLGVVPADGCRKQWPNAGDVIVVVGGRTGRDGIHGATFSSGEMTHAHETEFSHAVQIGNPITEKKMLDTLIQARDAGLYTAITDCGAGGLSSAVGEMGERIGAVVHLDRVPLKYAGLSYAEIWISEAQERMVLAAPPDKVDRLIKLFAGEDVEATVIGHFGVEDARLKLLYGEALVGQLDMDFLHNGLPRPTKRARWEVSPAPTPPVEEHTDYTDTLKRILAAPNVAGKEWVIRQYDHEVQGGSVVKPLVGVAHDGPSDAAVVRPVLSSGKGAVLACGLNPALGELDPYQSALHAVDEALRNVIAVGGDLGRTAILDNFCWGNCTKPDRMGSFVQAAKACRDAALAYGTPFISGKDSLNNEFQTDTGETITIPPTLLISAVSVIDDVTRCVTADAKAAGDAVILVGGTGPYLGGSHYLRVENLPTGNDVPPVDPERNRAVFEAVQNAIAAGYVRACHDLSEGGLAVAASEMAFAGGLGMDLDLAVVPVTAAGFTPEVALPTAALLFGESAGRLLLEAPPEHVDDVRRLLGDVAHGRIGTVTDARRLVITGLDGKALIDADTDALKAAWQGTFDW